MEAVLPDKAVSQGVIRPAKLQVILILLLVGISIVSLMSGPMSIAPITVVKILGARIFPH